MNKKLYRIIQTSPTYLNYNLNTSKSYRYSDKQSANIVRKFCIEIHFCIANYQKDDHHERIENRKPMDLKVKNVISYRIMSFRAFSDIIFYQAANIWLYKVIRTLCWKKLGSRYRSNLNFKNNPRFHKKK